MNAPVKTIEVPISLLADVFGDDHHPGEGESRGPLIPVNALLSIAKEIALLTTLVEDHSTTYNDLGMHFLWLSRRMETAATIGYTELRGLYDRIAELEAQLAAKPQAAE